MREKTFRELIAEGHYEYECYSCKFLFTCFTATCYRDYPCDMKQ
jgi:hypothetical protein